MQFTSPAKVFIGIAALVSLIFSVYLWFSGQKENGVFVGLWVPTMLSLGAFLKK